MQLREEAYDDFWYWIKERYNIYLRRESGQPFPWTNDPILRDYRFCNVFREHDTVTRWIREKWREPYASHPNLWFGMALARYFNWPETLEEIGFPVRWNPKRVTRILESRQKEYKIFTSAYMIRAESSPKKHWYGWSKARYVTEIVLDRLWQNRKEIVPKLTNTSLEGATKALMTQYGFAGFMAYEVVTDLRHTRYLENAPDIMTWANPGPGAERGLRRIFGVMQDGELIGRMRWLLKQAPLHLPKSFPPLEMRDIEHSLCEADKYMRVKYGEGRMRSLYRPH